MNDWTRTASAPLVVPLISMHGTSKAALVEQHLNAMAALRHALAGMRDLTPHGRDYPSSSDDGRTLRAASTQYRGWIDAITKVAVEVEQVAHRI